MPYEQLIVGITALAAALAAGHTADEIGRLGAIFTQLGDTLTTISTQKSRDEST